MGRIKSEWRSLRFTLGLLFSLLIVGWAVWALDWGIIWRSLKAVHYGWVALGVLLNLCVLWARTVRWGDLLQPHAGRFGPRFKALVMGQVVNQISPVRVGDLLRAYLLGQATAGSKAQALATIAVEKLWDLLVLIMTVFLVSWFFPMPDWLAKPARITLAITVTGLIVLVLLLWQEVQLVAWISHLSRRWVPAGHDRLVGLSRQLFNGLASARDIGLTSKILGWSALIWLLSGLLNYAIFLAFALPLGLVPAFLLLVVLQVGIAIPSLPGRIGIFQAICVLVLALFDLPADQAFSYSLILHLVVFLPPMIVALLLGWPLKLLSDYRWQAEYD